MSFVRVLLHAVWATKRHETILTKEKREILFRHIKQNARAKSIHIVCIGGYVDHVHCLISLEKEMSISKTLQLIKGESAFWANKVNLFQKKFKWADDYYAISVCDSSLKNVRNYILTQEEHHAKIDYEKEYEKLVKPYMDVSSESDLSDHGSSR